MNFKMHAMPTDHLFIVGNAFRILATSSCWFAFTSCVWLIEPREKWNKPLELQALSPKRSTSLASCWLFCSGLKPRASCNWISSLGKKNLIWTDAHEVWCLHFFILFEVRTVSDWRVGEFSTGPRHHPLNSYEWCLIFTGMSWRDCTLEHSNLFYSKIITATQLCLTQ